MLIKLFRTNQPAILLALPVVAMLFWWVYFFRVTEPGLSSEVSIFGLITVPVWVLIVSQILLSLTEAVLFNRILNDLELFEKPSYIPALCYIIISAMLIPSGQLQATSVPNFFILQASHSLLTVYRQSSAKSEAFLCGFLLGIGALFWLPLIILLFYAIIALSLLKSFNWRETVLLISGMAWPGFLFSALYYGWMGEWYFPEYQLSIEDFRFSFPDYSIHVKLFGISLFLMGISGVFLFLKHLQGTILKIRKQRMVWMWLSAFMIILAVAHPLLHGNGLPLLIIPCSFFISFLIVHTAFNKIFVALFYLTLLFFFSRYLLPFAG